MSNEEIKARIEFLLSRILSEKYNAKITIKFGGDKNVDKDKNSIIKEKSILS